MPRRQVRFGGLCLEDVSSPGDETKQRREAVAEHWLQLRSGNLDGEGSGAPFEASGQSPIHRLHEPDECKPVGASVQCFTAVYVDATPPTQGCDLRTYSLPDNGPIVYELPQPARLPLGCVYASIPPLNGQSSDSRSE